MIVNWTVISKMKTMSSIDSPLLTFNHKTLMTIPSQMPLQWFKVVLSTSSLELLPFVAEIISWCTSLPPLYITDWWRCKPYAAISSRSIPLSTWIKSLMQILSMTFSLQCISSFMQWSGVRPCLRTHKVLFLDRSIRLGSDSLVKSSNMPIGRLKWWPHLCCHLILQKFNIWLCVDTSQPNLKNPLTSMRPGRLLDVSFAYVFSDESDPMTSPHKPVNGNFSISNAYYD